jgi:hypothetical protein
LKYLFQIVIFAGIACGFIFPQLQACKRVVPWMVGCVVFLNFFEMRLSWQRFFRRELLVSWCIMCCRMGYMRGSASGSY